MSRIPGRDVDTVAREWSLFSRLFNVLLNNHNRLGWNPLFLLLRGGVARGLSGDGQQTIASTRNEGKKYRWMVWAGFSTDGRHGEKRGRRGCLDLMRSLDGARIVSME